MKIIELHAENVKRLTAVTITPNGSVVEIAGDNGAGKSSVIDSIMMALGGKSVIPAEPIRRGQKRAEIVLKLEGMTITRSWTPGGTKLVVESADGVQKSPQALLDKLLGSMTFDPVAFERMPPREQRATLIRLLKLEKRLAEIDDELKRRRAAAREHDQEAARLRAELQRQPEGWKDAPDKEIDVAGLTAEIERMRDHNERNRKMRDAVSAARVNEEKASADVGAAQLRVDRAKAELAAANAAYADAHDAYTKASETVARVKLGIEQLHDLDPSPIREQIATATETNRLVQVKRRATEIIADGKASRSKQDDELKVVEQLLDERAAMLTDAEFPVDGLGFDDDGVLFNELPFAQASASERLRASVAIAKAMNPKLRVMLVREGSLLDDKALAELYKMISDDGWQLWIERVGAGGKGAVVIEDGHVKGDDDDA